MHIDNLHDPAYNVNVSYKRLHGRFAFYIHKFPTYFDVYI